MKIWFVFSFFFFFLSARNFDNISFNSIMTIIPIRIRYTQNETQKIRDRTELSRRVEYYDIYFIRI